MEIPRSLIISLLAGCALAVDVTDIFMVDFTTNALGGCQYVGHDLLNTLVEEAYSFGHSGHDMIDAYKNGDLPAKRITDAFFLSPNESPLTTNDLDKISDVYNKAGAFFTGFGTVIDIDDMPVTAKPYLFCSMPYEAKEWDSPLFNPAGIPYRDDQGNPFPLSSDPDLTESREFLEDRGRVAVPYWNSYDGSYTVQEPEYGCFSPTTAATTIRDEGEFHAIILCPRMWGRQREFMEANQNFDPANPPDITEGDLFRFRLEDDPDPIARSMLDDALGGAGGGDLQKISDVFALSLNLLHEVIHITNPDSATDPAGGEFYMPSEVLRAPKAVSLMNPETYTLAALGYDYTSRGPRVQNKQPEFYTTVCTIED